MTPKKINQVCALWGVVLLCLGVLSDQPEVGYYNISCPLAETIVKDAVRDTFLKDNGIVADLMRMHFNDCFCRGCDGSVLLNSTPGNTAEKDSPVNVGLEGFDVIDDAKARLEFECKGTVSCADIIAFAARDSVELSGSLGYDVPAGRKDGRVSLASDAFTQIPAPTFNLAQVTQSFANKGLSQEDMVTLSGARTIGVSHCISFRDRLYNFSSRTKQDPTLDPTYAVFLKQQCPQGSNDPDVEVPMDPQSPTIMDVSYYRNVQANRGLFTSDQSLLTSPSTASLVNQNGNNPLLWQQKFAVAIVKMGLIGAGNAGEIRADCLFGNS